MKIKLILITFFIMTFGWSQCNVHDATDCECMEEGETDCDLLPDIQASWYGILNYSGGPSEYPQTGAGENNGRLRISVSTPNTGYGPLTVRGVDDNGFAYFLCDNDTIAVQMSIPSSTTGREQPGVHPPLSSYIHPHQEWIAARAQTG